MGKFNLQGESFGMKEKKQAVKAPEKGQKSMQSDSSIKSSHEVKKAVKTRNMTYKGHMQKAPMMNIRFTPDNYAYVRQESAMRGMSVTGFVNWLLDEYKADPSHVHDSGVYQG